MKKLPFYILALVLLATPAMAGSSWSDIFNNSATTVINLATQVTGTLGVANGGTGCSTGVRIISASSTDTALTTDCQINWNYATGSSKTETLYSGTIAGQALTVADEYGNAGQYQITITPASGQTINNYTYAYINQNNSQIRLVYDGVSNWTATQTGAGN